MRKRTAIFTAGATAMLLASGTAFTQDFGGEEDVSYAQQLWDALAGANLAGDDAIQARPYEGTEPHGAILQTLWDDLEVGGHEGQVIVKRNYGPAGITIDEVANNPSGNLAAVTVMFMREDGYAPDSGNWFWAKYLPDGSLDKSPDGAPLAGRVASCIECHAGAEGENDFTFTFNP